MAYVSNVSSDITAYTPITTSGSTTYAGLGNGTDWQDIIDAEVESESYRKTDYETRLAEQEYVVEQLETFRESLSTLNSSLDELDSMEEFLDVDVSGGDDEITATADGTSNTGTHTIIVNQLAQNDVWMNTGYGFDETTDEVAAADTNLSFTINGESFTLDVQSGTTLQELVDQINADSSMSSVVEASILDDGTNQYFVLAGAETGAENALTITDTGTLTGINAANLENTQTACDAQIKVDGFPSEDDEWITRSSNDIDDVISGLSMTLNDVTDDDGVRISTSYDTDALIENIETFVQAVNQVMYDLQVLTGRLETTYTTDDGEEEIAPTVESYALDLIYSDLKSSLSSIGLGFTRYDSDTGTGDLYSSLSQLGISTDTDEDSDTWGQLVLDDETLEEAVNDNPEAVAALFAQEEEVTISGSGLSYISQVESVTQGGDYTIEYELSGGTIQWATIDGISMEIDGDTILAPSESDAAGLYLRITETDDGTYSNDISVKQGKVGEINTKIEAWNSSDSGTLAILLESMENSIETLEDDIYDEEQRLDLLETELVRKYANLDSVLNTYSNIESQLESTIASLSSS